MYIMEIGTVWQADDEWWHGHGGSSLACGTTSCSNHTTNIILVIGRNLVLPLNFLFKISLEELKFCS